MSKQTKSLPSRSSKKILVCKIYTMSDKCCGEKQYGGGEVVKAGWSKEGSLKQDEREARTVQVISEQRPDYKSWLPRYPGEENFKEGVPQV